MVSETDEATARSTADELTEAGFDSGVLHSDDYSSLEPGFWVAYVGPFDDVGGARGAVGELEGDGYTGGLPALRRHGRGVQLVGAARAWRADRSRVPPSGDAAPPR